MFEAVYAQTAPGGGFLQDFLASPIIMMMVLIGILYFFMIRPQLKRAKEHQALVSGIRRGDVVVTAGGIVGKVSKVEDQEVQVEIADGVRIKVVRSTISDVRGKTEPAGTRA